MKIPSLLKEENLALYSAGGYNFHQWKSEKPGIIPEKKGPHMKKYLAVGNDNFENLIRNDGYYVDKTELLYDLVGETRNVVTLFTRPRRFGKTLTMSMMDCFFDITRDSHDVFEGLDITKKHPDFCREWMNQVPTLFLTLKDVEGRTFDLAYAKLEAVIADLCKKITFLADSDAVNPADKEIFYRLTFKTATEEEIQNSLKTIMRMMVSVYGKSVILLIDEYDVPLAKAHSNGYYPQMLDVIRGIMSSSLKTNEYLNFSVITGCLRISRESIFTGVNNFACYSVTSSRFCRYFGFSKAEVETMLNAFRLSDRFDLIRQWYDGYIFGDCEVFCPWDVVSYIAFAMNDGDVEPQNFWANTSSNEILTEFINHPGMNVSDKFELLLNGGILTEDISPELTYDTLTDSEKNLWSVLLMTGYLSKADPVIGKGKVKLKIPNAEIAELFRDTVVAKFNRTLDSSLADTFISAMWNADEETASSSLSDILWDSISYYDYGEAYYHGVLNGLFLSRGYGVDSNEEAGLGRLDLRIRDKANRRLLLLEFKRSAKEKDMDADCNDALAQIIRNGYAKSMPDGYLRQAVYGIAFYGKKAKVKKLQ